MNVNVFKNNGRNLTCRTHQASTQPLPRRKLFLDQRGRVWKKEANRKDSEPNCIRNAFQIN